MVSFHDLLNALYEIQGASDPNQPKDTLKERMDEIFEIASGMMQQSGFNPEDGP